MSELIKTIVLILFTVPVYYFIAIFISKRSLN